MNETGITTRENGLSFSLAAHTKPSWENHNISVSFHAAHTIRNLATRVHTTADIAACTNNTYWLLLVSYFLRKAHLPRLFPVSPSTTNCRLLVSIWVGRQRAIQSSGDNSNNRHHDCQLLFRCDPKRT